jgi:hypothetical protein
MSKYFDAEFALARPRLSHRYQVRSLSESKVSLLHSAQNHLKRIFTYIRFQCKSKLRYDELPVAPAVTTGELLRPMVTISRTMPVAG